MLVEFNRSPLVTAGSIDQPSQDEIKSSPTLWNASLEDALHYGGDITRAALSAMNLRGDKKYVIVDTKIHMLAPGQCPALPGWHTDGTPRLAPDVPAADWLDAMEGCSSAEQRTTLAKLATHPQHKGLPVIAAQEFLESPRFHLLVTGHGCLTEFIDGPVDLDCPDEPSRALYVELTRQVRGQVESRQIGKFEAQTCTVVEWDWWAVHQAKLADLPEWRFLIRVTESDYNEPQTDLRKVIRTQNQVYAPLDAGW